MAAISLASDPALCPHCGHLDEQFKDPQALRCVTSMDASLIALFRGTIGRVECKACRQPLPIIPSVALIYMDGIYWTVGNHPRLEVAELRARINEIACRCEPPAPVQQVPNYRSLLEKATFGFCHKR
jgi:hypothetical protein